MPEPREPGRTTGSCAALEDGAQSERPVLLPPGRRDGLVRRVATLYRKAHLTADEARYVHKRARTLALG
jgi:hypothetical protein